MKIPIALLTFLLAASALWSQDVDPYLATREQLKPRLVKFTGQIKVADALERLYRQTGNRVHDRRGPEAPKSVTLDLPGATFWQALDALTEALGCTFSPYHEDGVHLIDGERSPNVHRAGVFRFVIRRVAVLRDESRSWCQVSAEMMWEPRLEPLYFGPTSVRATFVGVGKPATLALGERSAVAGKRSVELEFRFPAPPRSSPAIELLEGKVTLLTPGRMLDFTFANLKAQKTGDVPRQESLEGVTVSLTQVNPLSQAWRFEIRVEDPPIQGTALESFQSRFTNNRLTLRRLEGGKEEVMTPAAERELAPGMFQATFVEVKGKALSDWTLKIRTPNPIVELEAPFRFENVPLP